MGHRIELGEIETHAITCTDVANAAAVAYDGDASGFARIGLAVVGAPGVGAVVRSRLRDRLPSFMHPERIVEVDGIPTTPSGKVDRLRLAELVAGSGPTSD